MLIVEEVPENGSDLARSLRSQGHQVVVAEGATEAMARAREGCFDVVVLGGDDSSASRSSGSDLVGRLRAALPEATLMLPAAGDRLELTPADARSPVSLAADPGSLARMVSEVVSTRNPSSTPHADETSGQSAFAPIIGKSAAIRELLRLVARVAETDSTALITGETGTGKELIGRAIHQASRRRERVFCAVNSAAFPESLLESELFGHRRGSFTGASANKKGLFEHADQGTVFLDEVAEMPLSMQAKLLRFLQTGEIRAVGSESARYVDVRLVTATNKDLEEEVRAGRFREDLYYRLAVIPIHLPPLRERSEDVALLAEHFLRRLAARMGKSVDGIDPHALELLSRYSWPGNVRQLENTIESGVALCHGTVLTADDFPLRLRERTREPAPDALQSLETLEKTHILRTLERVGGNRKRAAEILQISTTTLWRRLKEFEIEPQLLPAGRV